MAQPVTKFYTPEEYLVLEECATAKSEYYSGEIFAMAGGSSNHNLIAGNVHARLHQALKRKPCWIYQSDMRLLVKSNGLYTYPAVMVVCGKLEFAEGRMDTLANPILILEVLSQSTKDYDRQAKFDLYQALDSLQDYVLIDQERVHVQYFHRLDHGDWRLRTHRQLSESVTLDSVAVTIPLADIYDKLEWS